MTGSTKYKIVVMAPPPPPTSTTRTENTVDDDDGDDDDGGGGEEGEAVGRVVVWRKGVGNVHGVHLRLIFIRTHSFKYMRS